MNTLTQMIQRGKVLAPVGIHTLQHHAALETAESLNADQIQLGLVHLINFIQQAAQQIVITQFRLSFKSGFH